MDQIGLSIIKLILQILEAKTITLSLLSEEKYVNIPIYTYIICNILLSVSIICIFDSSHVYYISITYFRFVCGENLSTLSI